MIKSWREGMGREELLLFGAGNLVSSLAVHFLRGPAWHVLMSFGLMGAFCLIAAPFAPKRMEQSL
jgi:hypothetical protein